eukprot:gene4013-2867_t
MSQPPSDSMWLQESITVPDPLPNVTAEAPPPSTTTASDPIASTATNDDRTPPRQKVDAILHAAAQASASKEVELTKVSFDPAALTASAQRSSALRYSSARVPSMAGSSLVPAQEYDDLRLRYSKAKRELIRLSDIQKDLEYSRLELAKSQEEIKIVRDSHSKMKVELEQAINQADQDRRAKMSLEMKLADMDANHEKEVTFLKRQLDELREENAKRLHELNEQQESEAQMRIESMRAELSGLGMQMDTLVAQLEDTVAEKNEAENNLKNMAVELKNAELSLAELEKKLQASTDAFKGLEKQHRDYVLHAEKQLEEQLQTQKHLHEDHIQQLLSSKEASIAELKEELEAFSSKRRDLEDELASLRHKNQQLQEEMNAVGVKHEKEIRRITDDHQLAMSEKQMALEAAVREAKGSRSAIDEENQSLQRQLVKANEELSTVASILAQREKQINILEKDNDQLREAMSHREQELVQLSQEVEIATAAANDAAERVARLNAEKDQMEEVFEQDTKEHKSKCRALEASLMDCRKELLASRKEQIETADELRSLTTNLKSQIGDLTAECNALRLTVKQLRNGESDVEEVRRQLLQEKQVTEELRGNLAAAISRCNQLEDKLNERRAREISQKSSRSPVPNSQPSQSSLRPGNVNISHRAGSKRERPEDARVVAMSGLDTTHLMEAIKKLPNVAIADSKSNMPVPSNLTHLVTNGQLTIKLLSSLVKGCWVLPERYILDSLKHREWLCESDYGFQHEIPPLQNKRVYMTPAFVASRNYNTATILINEGNATIVENERDADVVLCMNSDTSLKEKVSRSGPIMNWEAFMETIYPFSMIPVRAVHYKDYITLDPVFFNTPFFIIYFNRENCEDENFGKFHDAGSDCEVLLFIACLLFCYLFLELICYYYVYVLVSTCL